MLETIQITSGPSREELFDGLRLFSEKRIVPFKIELNGSRNVPATYIQGITAQDESGESWNLILVIRKDFIMFNVKDGNIDAHWLMKDGEKLPEFVIVRASYSSRTRKGTITVESNEHQKRMHRIIIHNITASKKVVKEIMKNEINVLNIINWEVENVINYQGFVENSNYLLPQRDIIVKVFYFEN